MDKREARAIVAERIDELRALPYDELDRFAGDGELVEVRGASGVVYQLETQSFREADDLHVLVAIDDGRWRAFLPLTSSFILAPDGTFRGE
jgi:hypothetical protein